MCLRWCMMEQAITLQSCKISKMKRLVLIISLFISLQSFSQIAPIGFMRASEAVSCSDADAAAYITAAGISDPTYEGLLHCFFKGLKDSVALWDSMSTGAAYWLIGGTEGKVKLNIFDPDDDDASFRLTFVNSPSFTSSGVAWNGTTQYANTHFTPSSVGLLNSSGHLSYYSTTESQVASEFTMGALDGSLRNMSLIVRRTSNAAFFVYPGTVGQISTSNTTSLGYFIGSRTSISRADLYLNGVSKANSTTTATLTATTLPVFIGCVNYSGPALYTNKTCAFASIGVALTSDQARALNFLVEQLMDGMGVGVQ